MASQFYLAHHHFKLGMAAPWWGEMGKLDEAANEKMAENWLGKGFLQSLIHASYSRRSYVLYLGS